MCQILLCDDWLQKSAQAMILKGFFRSKCFYKKLLRGAVMGPSAQAMILRVSFFLPASKFLVQMFKRI